MKILLINKYFFQKRGAETYLFDQAELLKSRGHEVAYFAMHHPSNEPTEWSKYFVSEVDLQSRQGPLKDLATAGRFIYNLEAGNKLKKLLKDFKPDVVHLHNIYHQLSSSVLDALADYPAPKIMTLHDYKLICPNYSLFTEGAVCERCYRHKYYQAVCHKCLQDSYPASALAAVEMSLTKARQIYENVIDCFVSPSQFFRQKLADWQVKAKRVEHLPNFLFLDKMSPLYQPGDYYLYFGALDEPKGVADLLEVFGHMSSLKLKIVGSGPLKESMEETAAKQNLTNIEFLGHKPKEELFTLIRGSRAVIAPSIMYDNYPYNVLEAQALGKTVIGARLGGILEMIKHKENGYLFEPRNHFDLKARIEDLEESPDNLERFGRQARERTEKENSDRVHYDKLLKIYRSLR